MSEADMNWDDTDGPHPITLLPITVRGEIFNKLSQNDVNGLRLVCKQWDAEIQDYFDFAIKLRDECPVLEHVLQLRIAKLTVENLDGNRIRFDGTNDERPEGGPKLTLQKPNLLRHLILQHYSKDSKISPAHLDQLLQLCRKSVTHLDLEINLDTPEFQAGRSYKFQNLVKLTIYVVCDRIADVTDQSFLLSIIQNSRFPHLKYFEASFISVIGVPAQSLFRAILKLFGNLGTQLEGLVLFLGEVRTDFLEPNSEESVAFGRVNNLKSVKVGQWYPDPFNPTLILDFLLNQRRLENVDLQYLCRPTLERSSLQSLISNNYKTLVDVNARVSILPIPEAEPLDISALLQDCRQLKRLILTSEYFSVGEPQLINLGNLPKSLSSLDLLGFKTLTEDILVLLDSELMMTIESLQLTSGPEIYETSLRYSSNTSNTPGPVQLNSKVLEKVESLELENRKLQRLCISEKNSSSPVEEEELKKCQEMMKTFGYAHEYRFRELRQIRLLRDGQNRLRHPQNLGMNPLEHSVEVEELKLRDPKGNSVYLAWPWEIADTAHASRRQRYKRL